MSAVASDALLSLPPSPLPADVAARLVPLVAGLDAAGLWWLSGYAAGLAQRPASEAIAAPATADTGQRLSIVYGSQTGTAKRLAEQLARQAETRGLAVRLLRADAYPLRELKDERLLYVVISTQGDGDPPDDARGFVEFLAGRRAPALPQLAYAVLGLGDSSYPRFNETGRQVDERLAALGARRLFARGEADVDADTVATPWLGTALEHAGDVLAPAPPRATVTPLRVAAAPAASSRERPFAAEVLANQRLTGRRGSKDIRHVELSLEGSGLAYEPGDALGLWPTNDDAQVDAVLSALRLHGDTAVTHGGDDRPLRAWLTGHREVTRLARPFLQQHAERGGHDTLHAALQPGQADTLRTLLDSYTLPDLLRAYPSDWSATELVAALRPLQPRLYSIASSQRAVGAEAHLTVAHLQWLTDGAARWGTASHQLAQAAEGTTLPVFVEANTRFRLPADGSRDIVMIGPGTGVAPFRGFVQDRTATGARGRGWLFFGNPHRRDDFLYQLEWQQALKSGQLHRLDLAFSRDQADKIYVQQRLREHGRALYDWLEGGAHVYVCGDATRMARDVEAALLDIIATHGGHDADGAKDYLDTLARQGRYARDVY